MHPRPYEPIFTNIDGVLMISTLELCRAHKTTHDKILESMWASDFNYEKYVENVKTDYYKNIRGGASIMYYLTAYGYKYLVGMKRSKVKVVILEKLAIQQKKLSGDAVESKTGVKPEVVQVYYFTPKPKLFSY